MNKYIYILISLFSAFHLSAFAQEYSAEGDYTQYEGCSSESHLASIYVFSSLDGAKLTYGTKSTSKVEFYSYEHSISDNIRLENITTSTTGSYTFHTIDNLKNNYAYFVRENGIDRPAVWIITEIRIIAKQETNDGDFSEEIDGSAPVKLNISTENKEMNNLFYTWRIYDESDPENSIARYTESSFDYTFNRAGKYIIKLEIANNAFDCAFEVTPYKFEVFESSIDEIPNFISPGGSPGINDEFKIKYRSLVKFRCTIFNRWGVKLYQWTDPEKGWDGTYKGTRVKPGVYFYVIEATGSEGRKFRKMGDINILK